MKGVFEDFKLKAGTSKQKGEAKIMAFAFSRKKDSMAFWRSVVDGMPIYDGKYIRLIVRNELMMSDTDMERESNRIFCAKANGNVLIAGLGIGLIIKNIMPRVKDGTISKITVIEKSKDVIDLVGPYFKHKQIEYIHADILQWQPQPGTKYDTVYFDIWPTINTDNLPEINNLHSSFRKHLNKSNPDRFIGSWMKDNLNKMRRQEKNAYCW